MKKVVSVGLAVIDHVFKLKSILKIPTKIFVDNYFRVGWGNAATAVVALKQAAGKAIFWGRLRNDYYGDIILGELKKLGIDVWDVLV